MPTSLKKGAPASKKKTQTRKGTTGKQAQVRKTAPGNQRQGTKKRTIEEDSDKDSSSSEDIHQPRKKHAKQSWENNAEEVDAEEPDSSETVPDKGGDASDSEVNLHQFTWILY
jgi:hypothetical protein